MLTSGRNLINYQDTFFKKGNSSDSAIANPNRVEWATKEVVLKHPEFFIGQWPPSIVEANNKLLKIGILVSQDGSGKKFTGLLIREKDLEETRRIDFRLVESKTRIIFKDGVINFEVYDFFKDNFSFCVLPNKDLDPILVESFFNEQ
jgi:hypothetical protein